MMTETPATLAIPQRIEFMRRIHLFYRLEEDHFNSVAECANEESFETGEVIVQEGDSGDKFFMIYSGSVNITGKNRHGEEKSFKLVAGDYFGEEALLTPHDRNEKVIAAEKTLLLTLTKDIFDQQLKKVRQLKSNFTVATSSHQLARKMHFKWLREEDGEVIYFLARKHPYLLVRALAFPVILGTVGFLGILFGLLLNISFLLWLSVVILGFMISLAIWNGVDWGNDYYIVTNERVVWLEKVVGIYDSRQEAPLSAIQRINVQTDYLGRQLDYGTLIVRTIVGSTLNLHSVNHPYQAAALIEEHWKRTKQSSRKLEEETMRQALRERLLRKQSANVPPPSLIQKPDPKKKSPYEGTQRGFANFFRVRFEDLSTITYRKHWVVLVEKVWIPTLILLALFVGLVFGIIQVSKNTIPGLFSNTEVEAFLVLWFLMLIIVFAWWLYQYVDWSNDIFQVTPDQILDIHKKPIGEVSSDIASLDNILHLEYERKGILQVLFNYGNVNITIGGGKDMIFEDLFNPSGVQDDIERRRLERIAKKEQDAIKADRERMADWFAAYHHNRVEISLAEAVEKTLMENEESGEPDEPFDTPDDLENGGY